MKMKMKMKMPGLSSRLAMLALGTAMALPLVPSAAFAEDKVSVAVNTMQIFSSLDPAKVTDYTGYMAIVNMHVDGGRDLRNVGIFRPRTAADDDEVRLGRIDRLVIGLEQRSNLEIFAVGIFLQIGGQVGTDDTGGLDTECIEIVERGNIQN